MNTSGAGDNTELSPGTEQGDAKSASSIQLSVVRKGYHSRLAQDRTNGQVVKV